jgi:hypothetical protein
MKHTDLPQRWKNRIEDYLQKQGSKYKELSAYDFAGNSSIKITLDDGSYAFFKYAFYWIDKEAKEVAVFTEHCGYHIFNSGEILLETIDYEGNIVKTDDYRTE